MPIDSYSDQSYSFYFWVGWTQSLVLQVLFLTGLVLIFFRHDRERVSKILFWPCLLCAVLASIISYAYVIEFFVAYYSGAKYEMEVFKLRFIGPYWYAYMLTILCTFAPLLFFFRKFRSLCAVIIISLLGMLTFWLDQIVVFFS